MTACHRRPVAKDKGLFGRKRTCVPCVETVRQAIITMPWLVKAAKASSDGPSPKIKDMLANIVGKIVKLTCTCEESVKHAGKLLNNLQIRNILSSFKKGNMLHAFIVFVIPSHLKVITHF